MHLNVIIIIGLVLIILLLLINNHLKKRNNYGTTNKSIFLCDTCTYDYERACHNRERPNAKKCIDYKSRM